ncbi:hypothetical protein H2203_007145 [Taxawa tesnikishii (nom. ined.)]|nr:hypothetical protein H2203_007145 [Dothideales sp. JES 119]
MSLYLLQQAYTFSKPATNLDLRPTTTGTKRSFDDRLDDRANRSRGPPARKKRLLHIQPVPPTVLGGKYSPSSHSSTPNLLGMAKKRANTKAGKKANPKTSQANRVTKSKATTTKAAAPKARPTKAPATKIKGAATQDKRRGRPDKSTIPSPMTVTIPETNQDDLPREEANLSDLSDLELDLALGIKPGNAPPKYRIKLRYTAPKPNFTHGVPNDPKTALLATTIRMTFMDGSPEEEEIILDVVSTHPMTGVFREYRKAAEREKEPLCFMYKGARLTAWETPQELEMGETGVFIDVFPHVNEGKDGQKDSAEEGKEVNEVKRIITDPDQISALVEKELDDKDLALVMCKEGGRTTFLLTGTSKGVGDDLEKALEQALGMEEDVVEQQGQGADKDEAEQEQAAEGNVSTESEEEASEEE